MPLKSQEKIASYKKAGVDIEAGNRFVETIKPYIERTRRPEVISELGHYAGLFQIDKNRYKQPVLVSSTDGVGTKLKLAIDMNRYDTIGIDLVAMCVNDLLCMGAEPLFFLDYMASHRLDLERGVELIKGITEGCRQSRCALLGGETAEMPILYKAGDFDLAGFAVGIVDREAIIEGTSIAIGHKIIGLASSGFHSNGYSLIHKILSDTKSVLSDKPKGFSKSLGEALLAPTKIYTNTVMTLKREFDLFGIAHITGGGLLENIPRILPDRCAAFIDQSCWQQPVLFDWIQKAGNIDPREMLQVFNCGIGLVLVVSANQASEILQRSAGLGEEAMLIGEIKKREPGGDPITII